MGKKWTQDCCSYPHFGQVCAWELNQSGIFPFLSIESLRSR
ncbi:hypothetical protein N44_01789 [Microcystis aeruginosa NIES-44]|uniref:Uncharacterized protein n=1 Tax=Microcystis aeruginosa NIES-44 TaxID=449439 RepID=A0A0A1VTF9_MICAE|nr:hypothetical protein N44_01789 [Microcystis aeruginosa NIES-44]